MESRILHIFISHIADVYIHDIKDFVSEGDELRTAIIEYDAKRYKWGLKRIQE